VKILNKKVLVASLLIASVIIASFGVLNFGTRAQVAPVEVAIEPASVTVAPCTYFTVEVWLRNIEEPAVDGFDIIIHYDPTVVELISVNRGPFVPAADVFNVDPAPPLGDVHFWDTSINGAVMIGSGIIAYVKFHCKGIGTTPLNIDPGSKLWDSLMNPLPFVTIDGRVIQEYPTAHTYIEPPTITVPICVPFTVDVNVQKVINLRSFSLVLSYDTGSVDAFSIVPGAFIPNPTIDYELIDDPNGMIHFDVTGGAQVSGDGTIATITFHCTGAGKSILTIQIVKYYDGPNQTGNLIPTTTAGGRVIQFAYWEPVKLIDIVEWPYLYSLVPIPFALGTPPGYMEIMAELEAKGYTFDPADGTAMEVHFVNEHILESETQTGRVTSWWSSNTLGDGTRACMLSAEMDDGTSMAMAFVTNLLPPEQVPGVDPYIIVNAMPYMYLRFYWYVWPDPVYPLGRIISWPYWWYDSHSHPNWFWGPYYWWRTYTKALFLGIPWPPTDVNWAYWRPWWGWWWHWTYWRHWYWWSTYFPYDP